MSAVLSESPKTTKIATSELQEVEKWLLQMSGRLVAPDLMETSSLETITQQLARHKVGLISKELEKRALVRLDRYVAVCVCWGAG